MCSAFATAAYFNGYTHNIKFDQMNLATNFGNTFKNKKGQIVLRVKKHSHIIRRGNFRGRTPHLVLKWKKHLRYIQKSKNLSVWAGK